jgi:hypothetical protein
MTASNFTILTQKELTIDLSRPAMEYILGALGQCEQPTLEYSMECELDNFINTLQNLLERSEPETGNLDLIGA